MDAIAPLSALAQPTRLRVFMAIAGEPEGMLSGDIALATGIPANTASSHLSILRSAGLLTSVRDGRTVAYKVNRELVEKLADLLRSAVMPKI